MSYIMIVFCIIRFILFQAYLIFGLWILVRDLKSVLNRTCALFSFALAIWTFCDLFAGSSYVPYKILVSIGSTGWTSFPVFFLWLGLAFSQRKRILNSKIFYIVIFSLPLLFIYKQWANFLVIDIDTSSLFGFSIVYSKSVWKYLFSAYYLFFTLLGLYCIIDFGRKTKNLLVKKQAKIIFIAMIVPLIGGSITDVILPGFADIHAWPAIANILGSIWVFGQIYAITKYRFLVITPASAAENIIASMSEMLILLNPDREIVSINKAAEKMLGYKKEKLKNASIETILAGEDSKNILLNKVSSDNSVKNYDIFLKTEKGGLVPVLFSTSILKDDFGNVVGTVCVATDITREKEIDKAKTEFVSLASHQLRTPLTVMSWYAETLLSECGDNDCSDRQKKQLREIYKANQRIIELVNALLNVSRIELGTFIIEPKPTNLIDIADGAVKELLVEIQKKKLNIQKSYNTNLKSFNADPNLMQIVFQNLLSNAVKYTPVGGKINLTITKQDQNILIRVADNGYGIPYNQQSRVFTKLFRGGNIREREPEGTGLGLYIVKSVVEKSGGKIWFQSTENKGTIFYVSFPLKGMEHCDGVRSIRSTS